MFMEFGKSSSHPCDAHVLKDLGEECQRALKDARYNKHHHEQYESRI
jgi:hypothetical protein